MTRVQGFRSMRSYFVAMAGSTAFIVSMIAAAQAMWITRTFASGGMMFPIALGVSSLIAARLAWPTKQTADKADASPQADLMMVHRPTSDWQRRHSLALVLSCVLASIGVGTLRLSEFSGDNVNFLYLATDVIAHASWIAIALLAVIFPRTGHVAMIPLSAILMLVTIAAGGASQAITGQVSSALAFCILFVTGSHSIGRAKTWASLNRPGVTRSAASKESPSGLKSLLSLAVLSLILTVTSTLATATKVVLPDVQTVLLSGLRDSLDAVQVESRLGSGQYVNGSRFGSVRRDLLRDPQAVAIRAFSVSAPGYLRGNVFDLYSDRRWKSIDEFQREQRKRYLTQPSERSIDPIGLATTAKQGGSRRASRRFELAAPPLGTTPDPLAVTTSPRIETVEIHNDPIRGAIVFIPLATRWIEASSRQLSVSHHNAIVRGIDLTEPYVVGVTEEITPTPLSEEMRQVLLAVPGNLIPTATEILAPRINPTMSPRVKAQTLSNFFRNNFTYSLEYQPDMNRGELIGNFLRTRHPAHCEYFATATALLLRQSGVPTRYVTGYVADEMSSDSDYWVARNADAHAWVEAYDDEAQVWFPVESTPGRSYQTVNFPRIAEIDAADTADESLIAEASNRSVLQRIWTWIVLLRSNDPLMTALRLLQAPLLVVIAGLLWWRRISHKGELVDPMDRQSHKRLAEVDRRLRRHGLVRKSHETLHQFSDRIENTHDENLDSTLLSAMATWYRQYASARYRGQLPDAFVTSRNSQSPAT